jgi:hypothetical protein
MHHYRCQNLYITATASEPIVDTLIFPPHNSPMPQMSSTNRLLMAPQDMKDDLKHPHPDIPFATIRDETISALDTLAEIFTRKFKKAETPVIPPAPIKSAANKQPQSQVHPTLTSPLKRQYQTRFQKKSARHPTTHHNLRGLSHRQHGMQHLRGCQQARANFLREICRKISWTWVELIVQLLLAKTIGQKPK